MKKIFKDKLDDMEISMAKNTLFNHISEKEHYSSFLFISKPWKDLYIFSVLLKSDYPQFFKKQDIQIYFSKFIINKFHNELNMETVIGDVFSRHGEFSYKIELPFAGITKKELDQIKEVLLQFNQAFVHFFDDQNQRVDYEKHFQPYYTIFRENNILKKNILDEKIITENKVKKRI